MLHRIVVIAALALAPIASVAQQEETLADIRQQLTVLYRDITTLKRELSTTGGMNQGVAGNTPLDRLNAIEAELQRLTSKTEQLEFRVNSIAVDGTNRVGDLEFRLCELEADCSIGDLGDTPLLGGGEIPTGPTANPAQPSNDGPALAVGEKGDFERAREALASGDFRGAADQLSTFGTTYPGSPLTSEAEYMRGEALEGLGQMTDAARAYLAAFSGAPSGTIAPDALFKLGATLGAIGQTQDACLTLAEVDVRFPGNAAVADARQVMQNLGCQ
ncbi:tol-pal system protein YbgF [Yoonia sediminilitoris]|uniref:Cell division coordinator CpoB n=1 Tax=Yoonia sediminilitoris TaxID=1286148 RepID=A0A2T6KPU7_9RHOB|nr:tol-pal system protein YbgF [Yoonia sediminilitoris]PUB18545.1 tol-pal system protein YbgF [Yoonia sediminilitoris]RCW98713.1 tol-pal system protein YbgF [Yoonia sediminilitoris]